MSKKTILLTCVIVLVFTAVLLANKWRSSTDYDKITVTGNRTITTDEILDAARLKDSLIDAEELNLKIIHDRIARHPEIKRVFVNKEPPAELRIEVIEKTPIAVLNNGKELKLIDEEGDIFAFKNYEKIYDLPVISKNSSEDLSKDLEVRAALYIVMSAMKTGKRVYSQLSEINLNDTSKIVLYSSDNALPFYIDKNVNIQDVKVQDEIKRSLLVMDGFLSQIMSGLNQKEIEHVDLRYSNHIAVKFTVEEKTQTPAVEEKVTEDKSKKEKIEKTRKTTSR